MATILISTVNYNGQIADIIFSPDTGGTVNLGSYVLPQQLDLNYVYGVYDLSFSAFGSTCTFALWDPDKPTPTPTPAITLTPTPTITPTISLTPSITPSISETPTASGIRTIFVKFKPL